MNSLLKSISRSLWRERLFSLLNGLGLALGFAGFILSYQFINREQSYDAWNEDYENIYLVGLRQQGSSTEQTPPSLAPMLKDRLPELVEAGRLMHYPWNGVPIFGEETVLLNNVMMVDRSAASIFKVERMGGPLYTRPDQKEANIVLQEVAEKIFRTDSLIFDTPKSAAVLSAKLGYKETIYGVAADRKASLLDFDMLFIKEMESEGDGNPFLFQTFIQTKSGVNLEQLRQKINSLYADELSRNPANSSAFAKAEIYLDPLSHLHLRPQHGSKVPYLIVWVLGVLSLLILALAASNFANLVMAQSQRRGKEAAIRRVLGGSRTGIALQFTLEIFVQCLLAALAAWVLLVFGGGYLKRWLNDDLLPQLLSGKTILQLATAVVFVTLLSASYPALTLSGYKPVMALKGKISRSIGLFSFPNLLVTFQFILSLVFISGILMIRQQLHYMETTDKGFEPGQVIHLKGVGAFYSNTDPADIIRRRTRTDPSIEQVTASAFVPGNPNLPHKKYFDYVDNKIETDYIGVEAGFFETLDIPLVHGRDFQESEAQDTSKHLVVLNESAVKAFGMENPVGKTIRGCDLDFTVLGVAKDSKLYGFEEKVPPTVYTAGEECLEGMIKFSLLVKSAPGKADEALKSLEKLWKENEYAEGIPLDYEFLDQKYAELHARQQRLQDAFQAFTLLSVTIAALGLFSMSAYNAATRRKEVGIRKVMGASVASIFFQLNKSFLKLFIVANCVAIPISFLLARKWLENFAYNIGMNVWVFIAAGGITLGLILLTVCYQSLKAARSNPVSALRED